MAIQFPCAWCSQPLEVDEPFAGKSVGCPFCQKVVTVPQQSTLPARDVIGEVVARPGTAGPPTEHTRGRWLAVTGLGCGLVSLAAFIAGVLVSAPALPAIEALGPNQTPEEIMALIENDKAVGTAVIRGGVVMMGAMLAWLTGSVLSVAAVVRRSPPRAAAIAGVVVGCLPVAFLLLALLSSPAGL